MGCSASKLKDEEAVQLCRDRKNFIKQAVEQRTRFASGHIAYIHALRRVSLALRSYIDGDDHSGFISDGYSTTPFTPIKRLSPLDTVIPLKSSPLKSIQSERYVSRTVHYLRSGGNTSVSVEERPRSPETARINTYYHHQPTENFGVEGFFAMPSSSPMNNLYYTSSPFNRPHYPPHSPQNSQWDFFWNPFTSLESYGYPAQNGLDRISQDDEIVDLRQVREEEGIPDLEEEDEEEVAVPPKPERVVAEKYEIHMNPIREADAKDNHSQQHHHRQPHHPAEINITEANMSDQVKEFQSHVPKSVEISKPCEDVQLKLRDEHKMAVENADPGEAGTPDFTVYLNRRPTNMSEVMRDIENQFMRICNAAHEVSVMLEASRAQYSSTSTELTAITILNPVALFRSASSRSSSSRYLQTPPPFCSSYRDDCYETSSEFSEESCMISGSHQSTLDRLYAWEKKLYEEVKTGERIRRVYEKKCTQLRNQDVIGQDTSSMDKTRRIVRDLHTQIKISMHSIEAISGRIEKLRDEELHPQIMELLQGLARMWRTMAECHLTQKRVIDEAKLLLATPKLAERPPPAARLARSATNLEAELRNWRSSLHTWFEAQRSYVHALVGWLLRCAPPADPCDNRTRSPLSPPRSSGAPPIFEVCVHWSRVLDGLSEAHATEGLDFFAAGVASVVQQQKEEEAAAKRGEVVEEEVAAEKVAEVGVKVVCAGMSVAVGVLAELTISAAEGWEELLAKSSTAGNSENN